MNPKISVVCIGSASASPKTKTFRLPKESVMKRLDKLTSNDLKERWEAQIVPDKKSAGAKSDGVRSRLPDCT